MALESVCQRSRIRALLESLEEPCWILSTEGQILVRNAPARAIAESPSWVLDFIAGHSSLMPVGARLRFISLDAETVIFASDSTNVAKSLAHLESLGLDELHVETARHLLREFSETEIALLLGRSVVTVHTLVVNVFRQLGVRTRAELVDFAQRVRRSSLPPPRRSVAPISVVETRPCITIEMEASPHDHRERRTR